MYLTRENTHNLIQEPQHPEGEFGAVGHIPIVSEDVGIFNAGNLREVLAATTNFEGVFAHTLKCCAQPTLFQKKVV